MQVRCLVHFSNFVYCFDFIPMSFGRGSEELIPNRDWSEEPHFLKVCSEEPIQSPLGSKELLPEGEWSEEPIQSPSGSGSSFPNGDRSEAGGNSPIIFVPQRGLERRATSRRGVERRAYPQRGSERSKKRVFFSAQQGAVASLVILFFLE